MLPRSLGPNLAGHWLIALFSFLVLPSGFLPLLDCIFIRELVEFLPCYLAGASIDLMACHRSIGGVLPDEELIPMVNQGSPTIVQASLGEEDSANLCGSSPA